MESLRPNESEPSIDELLNLRLQQTVLDLEDAMSHETSGFDDVSPAEEEWAVNTQLVLIGNVIAERTGENWLEIVRSAINNRIAEESSSPLLEETDFFTAAFDDERLVTDIMSTVLPKNTLDMAGALAKAKLMTRDYYETSQKLRPESIDLDS